MTSFLFLGTLGTFSRVVLEALLPHACPLGVVVPGARAGLWPLPAPAAPSTELPMQCSPVEPSVATIAWRAGLPVWQAGRWTDEALAGLRSQDLDALIVACWPRRLPDALLALPRWGCLNVHPSLLPAYRGPAPLFWQRRDGVREGGVTVHRMSARLDEGPILAQSPLPLQDGATGAELDAATAQAGAALVVKSLVALAAGEEPARAQPPGGSAQPWPTEREFEVPTEWSALRAWNFLRATEEWQQPYTIRLRDGIVKVRGVRTFHPDEELDAPYQVEGRVLAVQFAGGVLRLTTV